MGMEARVIAPVSPYKTISPLVRYAHRRVKRGLRGAGDLCLHNAIRSGVQSRAVDPRRSRRRWNYARVASLHT